MYLLIMIQIEYYPTILVLNFTSRILTKLINFEYLDSVKL